MFDPYLLRWSLVPDGDPITTPAAQLLPVLPVLPRGEPAMLQRFALNLDRFGA
jgi:streptomycin 6-kinase